MNDKAKTILKTKLIEDDVLRLKSSSKINLGLWVKEKRSDGYHEIETIFFENDNLSDDVEIKFQESKEPSVNVSFLQKKLNDFIPPETNLAYKSANLFFDRMKATGSCNIKINKQIPLEAGLGGGSSNAACVLKGLNQIFNFPLSEDELLNLAGELGSDVPFFILGGTCLAKGRGEDLLRIENNLKLNVTVLKPENISISTKWAYNQLDSREFLYDRKSQIDNLIFALKKNDCDLLFRNIFNDFEKVIFSCHPELIKERKKLLDKGYSAVSLCGSGSALFGVSGK